MIEESLPKPQTDLPTPGAPKSPDDTFHTGSHTNGIRRGKFFIGFIALSALIAFTVGGFALGKNQNNKEVTQTPTITQTPYPNTDPMANWKTYQDLGNNYKFKYPSSYKTCNIKGEENLLHLEKSTVCAGGEGYSDIYISVNSKKSDFGTSEFPDCYTVKKENFIIAGIKGVKYSSVQVPNTDKKCVSQPVLYSSNLQLINIVIEKAGKFYEFAISNNSEARAPIDEKYQILSTFKFTDTAPSPTCRPRPSCLDSIPACKIVETADMCPKAPTPTKNHTVCTQEAKLCSDGSYVSRTGPNCAFATCPTQ